MNDPIEKSHIWNGCKNKMARRRYSKSCDIAGAARSGEFVYYGPWGWGHLLLSQITMVFILRRPVEPGSIAHRFGSRKQATTTHPPTHWGGVGFRPSFADFVVCIGEFLLPLSPWTSAPTGVTLSRQSWGGKFYRFFFRGMWVFMK